MRIKRIGLLAVVFLMSACVQTGVDRSTKYMETYIMETESVEKGIQYTLKIKQIFQDEEKPADIYELTFISKDQKIVEKGEVDSKSGYACELVDHKDGGKNNPSVVDMRCVFDGNVEMHSIKIDEKGNISTSNSVEVN